MLRIVGTLIVVSWLSGAQPPAPQTPPPAQPVAPPPAMQQPAPPPPAEQQPAPVPSLDPDRKTALVLLDRIESLVENALQSDSNKSDKDKSNQDKSEKEKPVATSGGAEIKPGSLEAKSGRVTVDRATLDEILSEVGQVKMMLQR